MHRSAQLLIFFDQTNVSANIMKIILILFFSSVIVSSAFSIDYYYYQGSQIQLNQREDKIVLVANETGKDKTSLENELKTFLESGDVLKNSYNNTYEVFFKNATGLSKVQNYISKAGSRKDLIKFIAPAYFTDDLKITIICADEFIVKLKRETDRSKLDILNISNGVQIIESFPGSREFNLKTFNGNSGTSLDLSEIYFQSGIFEFCEPNFICPDLCLLNYVPNDPMFNVQWELKNSGQLITADAGSDGVDPQTYNGISGSDTKVSQAWDITTGSPLIEIGLLDTGVDSTHPDLSANLLTGYDAVNNMNSVPVDSGSHGTCTAGVAGARGNNSLGVTGTAFGCKIRSYRVFNSAGSSSSVYDVRAFDKAKNYGAAVLSNSWGGGALSAAITNAIDSCAMYGNSGKGCVILFSSGNNGRNPVLYPSFLASVLSVGASTACDQRKAPGTGLQYWWGGNYGGDANGDLDLVVPTIFPTTDIQGTGGYNTNSGSAGDYIPDFMGTSASCPLAAGVAGLIFSVNPSLTAAQVKDALLRGCDKIDNIAYSTTKAYGQWNEYYGYGRVNAYNSLRLVAGIDVTPPTIVHDNVESGNSTYPVTISADITDQGGTLDNTSPKVIYRTNKNNAGWSAYDTTSFVSQLSNTFTFKIPGFGWETQVQYYITAKDNSNNRSYFPFHAPDTTNVCYYSIGNIQSVTQKFSSSAISAYGGSYSGTNPTFASFKILKTKVKTYLRDTRLGDLNFSLYSPLSNAAFNIKNVFCENSSGPTTGITGATTMDSAASFWKDGVQPYTGGLFKPDYIFRGFNGLNASGTWKLLFFDANNDGIGGTLDSAFLTLYKTSGATSSCAAINNVKDSVISFDTVAIDTVNFYLKNHGTGNLTVSGVTFNGTYASKFTLISSLPGPIVPNDSGLFKVRCDPSAPRPMESNPVTDDFENATMDISTNDPSKPVVKISLQTQYLLPVELSSFSSIVERNSVILNWTTAFEINNSGFDIERKLNGIITWEKVGNSTGRGSFNSPVNYSFTDNYIQAGKYNYRLKQIDFNGSFKYYNLSNEVVVGIPDKFELSQNYPNPFNPVTKIKYDLPVDSKVSIKIYDMTGREVASLVNSNQIAGYYIVEFNASNIASGIYLYNIVAEGGGKNFVSTKKMVLVK